MARLWIKILIIIVAIAVAGYIGIKRKANVGFQWSEEEKKMLNQVSNCRILSTGDRTLGAQVVPSEDIQIDWNEDLAYFAVSDMQHTTVGYEKPKFEGSLPVYSFKSRRFSIPKLVSSATKAALYKKNEWSPIGIGLIRVEGEEGSSDLYIHYTNWNRTIQQRDPSIGIAKVVRNTEGEIEYQHMYSFRHPAIVAPNDIVPISATEFYFTNDHTGLFAHSPIGHAGDLLGIGTGQVGFCNVEKNHCQALVEGIVFANSIVLNADKSRVYVTESLGDRVLVYKRDPQTNGLSLEDTIPLFGFLDNLNFDHEGRIWAMASIDLLAMSMSVSDPSPNRTSVPLISYRITPKKVGDKVFSKPTRSSVETEHHYAEIMFVDNGETISPATVATPTLHNTILIGSLASERIVECDVNAD